MKQPTERWLQRRDERLRKLAAKVNGFAFYDRVYESWVTATNDGLFIPQRSEYEAMLRLMQ
jgi:hypothetical protein